MLQDISGFLWRFSDQMTSSSVSACFWFALMYLCVCRWTHLKRTNDAWKVSSLVLSRFLPSDSLIFLLLKFNLKEIHELVLVCGLWCVKWTVDLWPPDFGVRPSSPATSVGCGISANTRRCWSWRAATAGMRSTSTWANVAPMFTRPRSERHRLHHDTATAASAQTVCVCAGTQWRPAGSPTRPEWSGGRWPAPTATAAWSEPSSAATCRPRPSDTESGWWVLLLLLFPGGSDQISGSVWFRQNHFLVGLMSFQNSHHRGAEPYGLKVLSWFIVTTMTNSSYRHWNILRWIDIYWK